MVRSSNSKAKNTNDLKTFDWSPQKLKAFDLASWLIDLKLSKIWTLTPDRVNFVTLFTKPAYQLFENPAHAKSNPIKERIFRILSLCIKHYDHLFGKSLHTHIYMIVCLILFFIKIFSCSNYHHAKSSILGTFR
jgi:hypothetical protein